MARPLQSCPAPLLAGLPASRACHPAGHRAAATHTSRHAVVSLNPVQNPGQARIATRPFRQSFNLAEHLKVTNATFEHGLLTIHLKREVPEALKPRRIEIATASGQSSVPQNNVTTLEQNKVA